MKYEVKDIPGFDGRYKASSLGGIVGIRFGKLLKPGINTHGYLTVTIYHNGKKLTRTVHKLVAMAFLPNSDTSLEVNHKDANKANNRADNLEWVTRKQNIIHAHANGLVPSSCFKAGDQHWTQTLPEKIPRGSYKRNAKLTEDKVSQIKAALREGQPGKELAKRFGVAQSIISRIKSGHIWAHVT